MTAAPASRRNILVVDDDPQLRALLEGVLGEKYEVRTVSSGEDALAEVQAGSRQPDLVLCDVVMDGMNGIQCLEQLTARMPKLRVIMMTVDNSTETVLNSLRKRAYDFLAKPFTLEELRETVQDALDTPAYEEFRVHSATPQWVEVETPCSLSSARRLFRFISQLRTEMPPETQAEVALAFRELLHNAVEHGGKNDASRNVRICYLRLDGVVIYIIRDPGEGFRLEEIEHAAVSNPPEEPLRHVRRREQMHLRAGGFGLFLSRQLVDELVFNQKRNEVVFVKYLK